MQAQDIERALRVMSDYIRQKTGRQITVMVAGGVVSTVYLKNRNSTQDVDFFVGRSNKEDQALIEKARKHATDRSSNPKLTSLWFNSQITAFIPSDLRPHLQMESKRQNVVVFEGQGLRLLAAPWAYQVCAKIDRMVRGGGKSHDASDAASYLHQHLVAVQQATIRADQLDQSMRDYRLRIDGIHAQLRREYQKLNGLLTEHGNQITGL